ncbi:MAG: YjjG family noncanonical pyrimidine nucleotidase [Acidimicrobiia bacterium]
MPYTTLLFDLDHTLFDSDASEAEAFDITMRAAGISDPASVFDAYRRINGALWEGVEAGRVQPIEVRTLRFQRLFDQIGIDADIDAMADLFVRSLGDHGDLYPGARQVLDHLAGRARLALVTNGLSDVQRARLARCELDDLFEAVVISSEVGVTKPRPEIFQTAFDRLGGPPKHSAVMVGDSLTSDIAGAIRFGIDTCWYNPNRADRNGFEVTHEVTDLAELTYLVA